MAGKRELIEPHEGDKRYVRRDESGQFSESDDLNRSLSSDNNREAMGTSEPGQGDKGDRSGRGDQGNASTSGKPSGKRGAAGRRNKKPGKGGMGDSNDSSKR
ncbi:MAG: hypothetical protein ABIW94_01770 [Gemmatimonadaceae bacterium]